MYQQIKFGE